MQKWNRMITLFVAATLVTGPVVQPADAQTVNSQRTLQITPMPQTAPSQSASNISASSPGYVSRFLTQPLHMQDVEQAHDFYYQVPKAQLGANNYIELIWTQSDLLNPTHSTLTVLVDDIPMQSVFLDGQQNQIRIPLNQENLTQGYHKVTIWKYSLVSDDLCSDEYNPANWVRIEPGSSVFLDTKETWSTSNPLQEFPHPFVERGTPDEVYGAIVLPDSSSAELIAAALELSTHLSAQTASKKHVPIMTESEWTSAAASPHAIALGSMDAWTGPIKQTVVDHKLKAENEELVLQYFSVADGQAKKQMLLVTGENDDAIQEKLHVLTDSKLVKQLTGTQAVIAETPKKTETNASASILTFAAAGYEHMLLNEVDSHSEDLFITIPSYWNITGESWLNLKLKVSPLLMDGELDGEEQKLNPFPRGLTVTINGIPKTISLEELKQMNAESDSYNIRIPLAPYMQENSNTVNIAFSANIGEVGSACYRERNDGRWMFIDKQSGLEIPYEVSKEASFKHWPAPFVNDQGMNQTAFLVPQQMNGKFLTQLSMVANEMVSLTSNENEVAVLQEPLDDQAKEMLHNHNVIVLGDPGQYPSLQAVKDQLLISENGGQGSFANYSVIAEMAEYAAWVQPSVWNKDYALAVFQSTNEAKQASGENVHPQLLSFLKNEHIQSQIAVMSKSQEVFYPDAKAEEQAVAASGTVKGAVGQEEPIASIPVWIWILIFVQFFVVLYVVVKLWRKQVKSNRG